jgi:hypothetical protein
LSEQISFYPEVQTLAARRGSDVRVVARLALASASRGSMTRATQPEPPVARQEIDASP